MDKDAMIKIEDSNICNLGSELEKLVKKGAAEKEEAWKGVGQKPGVEVWRIEKFKVVPWPKDEYGSFYTGDSYIVLSTYKKEGSDGLHWNAHMWVGLGTTMDEAGTAAYKIVELDDLFDRQIVLFRDVQGSECQLFLSYFNHIKILDGGVESGFKHVPVEEYKPRLFHVKGKKNFRVRQVPLNYSSLNSNDVFILDNGLFIYVWKGANSNSFEKFKAASVAEEIRADRKSLPKVFTLEESTSNNVHEFWNVLGGKGDISSDSNIKDSDIVGQKSMFRLSDSSGKLEFTEVPYALSSLAAEDIFIIDNGSEVIGWIGDQASQVEKADTLKFAEQYLKDYSKDLKTPITMVKKGRESANFHSSF